MHKYYIIDDNCPVKVHRKSKIPVVWGGCIGMAYYVLRGLLDLNTAADTVLVKMATFN
jgi:hypothetical protein